MVHVNKTGGRASGVAVIISASTPGVSRTAQDFADENGVVIIQDNRNLASNIKKFVGQYFPCE